MCRVVVSCGCGTSGDAVKCSGASYGECTTDGCITTDIGSTANTGTTSNDECTIIYCGGSGCVRDGSDTRDICCCECGSILYS